MKIKLIYLMFINILLILTIFGQSLYLSYHQNNQQIPNPIDLFDVKVTITELIKNISMSFTHYHKYTFYIYFGILCITLISAFLFVYGKKNNKISNKELLWQKQIVVINIIINVFIILYNNAHTDLIFPKISSPIEHYFHFLLTPLNTILYILIISYFINNYSMAVTKFSNKVTHKMGKYPLDWIK